MHLQYCSYMYCKYISKNYSSYLPKTSVLNGYFPHLIIIPSQIGYIFKNILTSKSGAKMR